MPFGANSTVGRISHFQSTKRAESIGRDLELTTIRLSPGDIGIAGRTLAVVLFAILLTLTATLLLLKGVRIGMPLAVLTAVVPLLGREWLVSYPSRIATRRTREVLRQSAEGVNLMIMSLRHEPSVTRAITFASDQDNAFSKELRGCSWKVIMGKCESFEEALLELGDRWSRLGDDLKSSLNSMVTSSREATQDGRRRALDRANQAMIAGGKRRIEEYATSLSTPSMLIFGLGILLPLMVGSFLPMLSWDLWSMDGMSGEGLRAEGSPTLQMVFVMNLLFPAVAYIIATSALSSHPIEQGRDLSGLARTDIASIALLLIVSCALCLSVWFALEDSVFKSAFLLFAAMGPISGWSAIKGRSSYGDGSQSGELEDVLFRTGARMLDGENFESSLRAAARGLSKDGPRTAQALSLRNLLSTGGPEVDAVLADLSFGERNATRGLWITREAAAKDETAAGALAMDLACYLKDLRDLERTLRNRIRPTISMMKTTALVLAPIVLGVTYTIYLSLASMLGGNGGATGASAFFLVLGVFLAQMDAVVAYFVWGIEGRRSPRRLAGAIGGYVMISEATYSATALLASS